jgi:hypothetical protein
MSGTSSSNGSHASLLKANAPRAREIVRGSALGIERPEL